MKGIKKYLFIMAALAAVCGFVACSNDDDDSPSTVAVFKDATNTYTVTFLNDNTYSVSVAEMGTAETGTYTGKPKEAGDVTLTPKKVVIDITDSGKFVLGDATSDDKPYKVTVDSKGTCVIEDITFTRQ